MATVKVIDAAAWAALPEISLLEGEDLATKGLASDTYRCIRSDVDSAVVTQWTGLGVEWANEVGAASVYTVDLTAAGVEWATEVGAPAVSLADLVATGVEWANEVGAPTVTETGGSTTRRKLVSTSNSANTGMHSTSTITMAADDVTIAFWWRPTNESTNNGRTLFAGHAGQYQVYTGAGTAQNIRNLIARMDGTNASTITTQITAINTWFHVCVHFGQNHSGGTDVEVYINGSSVATVTGAGSSTEMTTAGTHYILGDDASGSASDDGCIGEIFDFCMMDGIIGVTDTNYNGGSWQDLTSTGLAALKYRIDGQNAGDPGEDSSGNGHDFTVESSGVTLSDTSLPSGANP